MCELYGGFSNYLGTYPTLNFHYDAPSYTCYYNNDLSQQCCSTADMINRWQAQQTINSLQAQTQSLKNLENANKLINSVKPISFEEEKEENMYYETISDYMDKEFLYESELKEIEDKFYFNFKDLGDDIINKKNKIYKISKKIIKDLQSKSYVIRYINEINIREYSHASNSASIYYNNKLVSYYISDINANKKDEENIKNMCNTILRKDIPEYQQFYEKYKNRIVKDNEYEDLSYYEKILKENS